MRQFEPDTSIDGLDIERPLRIGVEKGDVFRILRNTEEAYYGFGEAYLSVVSSGRVKGWTKHRQMTLNLVVVSGQARFVFFDDRAGSTSHGQFAEVYASMPTEFVRITVPPGVWTAMQCVGREPSAILNIADYVHSPSEQLRCELDAIPFEW